MEKLRYLLVAIAALTLMMSVFSSVNPSYFAGLNAFAEDDQEEEDDHTGTSGSDDDESDDDHEVDDEHEDNEADDESGNGQGGDGKEHEQALGDNSKVKLEVEDGYLDLEVEIEDGDLDDGSYDVAFSCPDSDVDKVFEDALQIDNGEGSFETEIALDEGTYIGCEVETGGLSTTFASFNITTDEEKDEEDDEEDDDEHDDQVDDEHENNDEHDQKSKLKVEDDGVEIEVEAEGLELTDGTYDAVFACKDPAISMTLPDAFEVDGGKGELEETIGLAQDDYSGCEITVEGTELASFNSFTVNGEKDEEEEDESEHQAHEKSKEKNKRLVTTTNGATIHQKHRGEHPSSPGDYELGWNYKLDAEGTAMQSETPDEPFAEVRLNMTVWKSNSALILLDVINGTVTVDDQDYKVVLGFAYYTILHDTLRVGALAVDDDGNVYKLKMRGTAADGAEFPTESGSIDLVYEGSSGPAQNSFGDWELSLKGPVSAK